MKIQVLIRIYYITGILLLMPCKGMTQAGEKLADRLYLSAKTHYGFILPHNKSMAYSVTRNFPAYELCISARSKSSSAYGSLYRYPETGIGFFTAVMHRNNVFGEVYALYPFIHIPVNKNTQTASINYQIGFGLSYLTKIWDKNTNLPNIAIGTHGNIYFNFSLDGRIKISRRLEATGGCGITHFSNGNIKKPNLGINYVSAAGGVVYKINKQPLTTGEPQGLGSLPLWEFSTVGSAGIRTYLLSHNDQYWCYTLSTDAARNLSYKRKTGAGLDLFYNRALKPYLDTLELDAGRALNFIQAGLHASHGLTYHRLTLTIQAGVYLYARYKEKPLYSRFGLHYKISNHLMSSLALKTHYATAEVVEWGAGYTFCSKKHKTIQTARKP